MNEKDEAKNANTEYSKSMNSTTIPAMREIYPSIITHKSATIPTMEKIPESTPTAQSGEGGGSESDSGGGSGESGDSSGNSE